MANVVAALQTKMGMIRYVMKNELRMDTDVRLVSAQCKDLLIAFILIFPQLDENLTCFNFCIALFLCIMIVARLCVRSTIRKVFEGLGIERLQIFEQRRHEGTVPYVLEFISA